MGGSHVPAFHSRERRVPLHDSPGRRAAVADLVAIPASGVALAQSPPCGTDNISLVNRDRSAVRMALGRWSARWRRRRKGKAPVYAGTALRSLDSQMSHQDAINAAALSAEVSRSNDHHLLELLSTSRSSIGYRYQGDWRLYFLEFERRAVTPRRVRARLKNHPRSFASGWAGLDHAGQLPLALFVFETHDAEDTFLLAAGAHRLPICTSNLELITGLGALREVWRWPPPNAPGRLPLHRLGDGYKVVPSRSRHFLQGSYGPT